MVGGQVEVCDAVAVEVGRAGDVVAAPTMAAGWTIQQIGDFDGDRLPDVLWRNDNGALTVERNLGGGGFSAYSLPSTDLHLRILPGGAQAIDPSGDGKADIVAYDDSGAVQIWDSGDTPGTFSTTAGPKLRPASHILLPGQPPHDYDGDGVADVLFQLPNGHVELALSNADPSAPFTDVGLAPDGFSVVGAGDFDGDALGDILLQNSSTGELKLWTGGVDDTGVWFVLVDLPTAAGSTVRGVGDFNGDGKADILLQSASGQLSVAATTGANFAVTQTALGTLALPWSVAATADFNGDGKLDMLVRNSSNGQLQVWASRPDTVAFDHISVGAQTSAWTLAEAGDFTGDGRADILWRDTSGHTSLWVSQPGAAPTFTHLDGPTIPMDWHIV